jgi:predicted phosphodiesterase
MATSRWPGKSSESVLNIKILTPIKMRIGIISDVHANMIALETVIADMEQQDLALIVSLGDVVGRGNRSDEAALRVKELAQIHVLGNHDRGVIIYPQYQNSAKLSEDVMSWLSGMVDRKEHCFELDTGIGPVTFMHSFMDGPRYAYLSDPRLIWTYRVPDSKVIFLGHEHVEHVYRVDRNSQRIESAQITGFSSSFHKRYAIKEEDSLVAVVPSVGNPRDDYRRTGYAVLDDVAQYVEVVRIPYDTGLLARQMKDDGAPMGYICDFFMHGPVPATFTRMEKLKYAISSANSRAVRWIRETLAR